MTDRKLIFTPAWVAAVKPEAAPVEWCDERQQGLVLRIQPTGRKTWIARYWLNGRDRRYRLGTYPEQRLKAARKAARRAIGLAQNGTDPQLERDRLRVGGDVSAAVSAWLDDAKHGPGARWKGGLEGGSARSFLPHVRRFQSELGGRRLSELTPNDIERFVSGPEAPATRNRALTAVRGFFRWALRKSLIQRDPSAELGKERETERARTLTDDELRALVHGFDATRYGRAVRLLALTGLRRDEVLSARWTWLDAETGLLAIPPEAEKMGRTRGEARRVALSPEAVALLTEQRKAQFAEGVRSEFIFATTTGERPHPDALKPTLYKLRGMRGNGLPASKDKRAKARPVLLPKDATIHDLRRTVADALLNKLGAAPWVVDHVVLGHARPKLLRTYMPVLPLDEARAALTRWAGELEKITATPVQTDAR